ncbi:MAG: pyruvate kinase [Candidatus Thermoplasmatota archaeon]|nr:pyruvate kinase [Candidatus Thermoplasmatota archaeon]MEC8576170.1 pyruvate kinase [Candidatus Thermoplasmatota archaeon]MEC9212070.1 pyruvate kinase [Candidatus Thermoplasmatota archaeon]MEE3084279.1 pyruvate kinase [Candidatus Thermoplasmatota archaeon]
MRRTRIVATIGPACDDRSSLKALMEAGMDVCRLNYSHGEPDDKTELYLTIRDIEDELGRPTCILADLPGPKLRLGIFPDVEMLEEGTEITLLCGRASLETTNGTTFPVEYDGLSAELKTGDPILLSDGLIRLTVKSTEGKAGGSVRCVVEDGGPISSRKGVNVPGTLVDLPAIGPKDKAALQHALENGADYIAVSYVRTAEDLMPAKEAVEAASMHVPVLAKIEHPVALENLDSILDVADAVMVARGDLGVEIPLENVPVVQQRIIDKALERGMPVVVATQMLDSMTFQPRPTRAEVSDVSTAIRHGATGVMLSGETASGKFPLESVQTMARIAAATEEGLDTHELRPTALARFRSTRAVAHAGVELAREAGAARIVVATEHGTSARLVSGYHPAIPVTAVSDRLRALRRTCLLPGVDAVLCKEHDRGSNTMREAVDRLVLQGRIHPGDRVVAISGSPLAMRGATSTLRLYKIGESGEILDAQ